MFDLIIESDFIIRGPSKPLSNNASSNQSNFFNWHPGVQSSAIQAFDQQADNYGKKIKHSTIRKKWQSETRRTRNLHTKSSKMSASSTKQRKRRTRRKRK